MFEQFEDTVRLAKSNVEPFQSPYQDFVLYPSSITPGILLGMNVLKPEGKGKAPLLMELHGWHMSMPKPVRRDAPPDRGGYLVAQIDMRGRAFSGGRPDCNGLELIDIWDAARYVREHYAAYLADPEVVYLEGGSGGGGNALACAAKFPDLFAAVTALCGISDYQLWYEQDRNGEFRDDMDIWIGCPPSEDKERYMARSGLHLCGNVLTPLYIAHGETDIRVPVSHSRDYAERMRAIGKGSLLQYDELEGVGDHKHWGLATEQQMRRIGERSERNRMQHRRPIEIPPEGRFTVGGYLYTKRFRLMLESVHAVAELEYDLGRNRFDVTAGKPYRYEIRLQSGESIAGICRVRV